MLEPAESASPLAMMTADERVHSDLWNFVEPIGLHPVGCGAAEFEERASLRRWMPYRFRWRVGYAVADALSAAAPGNGKVFLFLTL